MLATAEVYQLVENTKANKALAGNLLPANNNPSILDLEGFSSLTVVDDDPKGALPIAFGLYNMYTPSQDKYDDVFVNLEPVKMKAHQLGVAEESAEQHGAYRVGSHCFLALHTVLSFRRSRTSFRELPDLGSFPQYYRAFAEPLARPLHQCIVDELIRRTVGEVNYDMKRNTTVDLYDKHANMNENSDELWRDYSGFVVGDKHRFAEFEISKENLLAVLTEALNGQDSLPEDAQFVPLSPRSASLFIDYDQNLSVIDRQTYLEYLFALQGVSGIVAIDAEQNPIGYVLALDDRILQCYADNLEIANLLVRELVRSSKVEQFKLFAAAHESSIFKQLSKKADVVRRVRRFHSRIVPSNVKWPQIFMLNIGVHLF
ncbi:Acetyltransf-18 domain-containing protein [Aphelenchoides fujianensis]|nr:Acetyltransf-18 domain-containing protein [Aphelenchoides fujianensis]